MRLIEVWLQSAMSWASLHVGYPQPHSAGASGARVSGDPLYGIAFLVGVLCLCGMYLFLIRGFGELYDYWTTRGWRAAAHRRKLK